MVKRACVLLSAAVVAACASRHGRAVSDLPRTDGCRWPVAPVVLRQAADTVYQSWTYEAGQLPDRVTPSSLPALAAFLDTVRIRVGALDARALLARQIAYYASRPDSDSQGEAANG